MTHRTEVHDYQWYAESMRGWVALLRGINVGGHNRLPMKALSRIFEDAGCRQVKTYIQSGNVAFNAQISSTGQFTNTIGKAIDQEFGFLPAIQLLTARALRATIAANPYPQATAEPKSLHLAFLETPPEPANIESIERLLTESESYTLTDNVLYFYAPEGIARSKFAGSIEKILRVKSTARNWRTITALEELTSV